MFNATIVVGGLRSAYQAPPVGSIPIILTDVKLDALGTANEDPKIIGKESIYVGDGLIKVVPAKRRTRQ